MTIGVRLTALTVGHRRKDTTNDWIAGVCCAWVEVFAVIGRVNTLTEGATIAGALVAVVARGILLQCVVASSPITGHDHIRLAVAGGWITVILGAWIAVIAHLIDETAATPFTGRDSTDVVGGWAIAGHHTRSATTGGIQCFYAADDIGIGGCETVVTQLRSI